MAKKIAKKVTKKVTKKVVKKAPATKASLLTVGDKAPAFVLEDQDGNKVALQDFKGQNVVVYFYPKAMTPGCTVQACSLRDSQSQLSKENIVVLGISADAVKKLKQFEDKQKLNFTLLSDPDHKVCEAYGTWALKKFMGREYMGILRQSFLLDKKGKIIHIMDKVNTTTHHDDVLKVFKNQK